MIFHRQGNTFTRFMCAALPGLAISCTVALPAFAASRMDPPWHIDSFCHRGAPAARRCLVRARQGIIVFTLAEMAAAPSVQWSDGLAVLSSSRNDGSRQLRFFAPPEKLSAPFTQVRAYNTQQRLIAFYADRRLHLRAMFGGDHDLAALTLPDGSLNTLQTHFEGRNLQVSWRDSHGQSQEQTLRTKD
jgi:hypothetical protein